MRPGDVGYAQAALTACLSALDDTLTLGPERVEVLNSWALPEDGFCVIYRHPWHPDLTIGYCARARFSTEDYADAEPGDLAFEVANFQISEPLGSVRERLAFDEQGVGWHGDLSDGRPVRPIG